MRLRTRPRASDVAPLTERSLLGEEDERALDGCALCGVAGERVGVVEVLGGVAEGKQPERACVGPERELRGHELGDGSAGAVADAEREVVAATEDAVADPELAPADDLLRDRRRLVRRQRAPGCPAHTGCKRLSDLSDPPSRLWVCEDYPQKEAAGCQH